MVGGPGIVRMYVVYKFKIMNVQAMEVPFYYSYDSSGYFCCFDLRLEGLKSDVMVTLKSLF